ncbi:antitoxin VapB [Pseudomonas mediterranea]|uniref:Antitoxin VapB n=1 Tax=Pseudomonas mediterranea TaxID=183795 RepID=A0AAX2D575_9PSED|nr:antitoxin VapB [Pseudomonas mediterranea]
MTTLNDAKVFALGRVGNITPIDGTWDSWFDGNTVTADCMTGSELPIDQERESFGCSSTPAHSSR